MCGIVGGNHIDWDYQAAIECLRHRGPDGNRIEVYNGITFAFTRLAIRDLNLRAMQPMSSRDGKVHLVYNGEIYGFDRLKRELSSKYCFNTSSDTEVVLNAYLRYGESFVDHIDGMYAIAIYDERDRKIRLFRDRVGIKPLYYYYSEGKFAFASELKGIVNLVGERELAVDNTSICDFLYYQYIPSPKSLYKNVYKLPPAHMLVFDTDRMIIENCDKYWNVKVNESTKRTRSEEEISRDIRKLISNSVKEQMIADVPVGVYLSGGVDSSIISFESSRIKSDICAFTIGFMDKTYDETRYADLMINKFQLNSVKKKLDESDLQSIKGNLKEWYDEPFADTSAYPTYEVSKLAKSKVTVVLTGDGGDELFGGYQRYREFANNVRLCNRTYKSIKNLCAYILRYGGITNRISEVFESSLNIYKRYMGFQQLYPNKEIIKYLEKYDIPEDYDVLWFFRKYWKRDLPPITRARYLDFMTYLPEDVLTKVDRASMQVSLESRVPLLSRDIIEYMFSLSSEDCNPNNTLKESLKRAYMDQIPHEILFRKKWGFAVPNGYLRGEYSVGDLYLGILNREWRM